jgi:tetratricopeptide (TPR) repeat protein
MIPVFVCFATLVLATQGSAQSQGPAVEAKASAALDEEAIAKANALVRVGRIKEAETLLQSASVASPKSVLLHEALGELYFQQRNFEASVRELSLALQIDPSSWRYSMLLASALINWAHFEVAVDFLRAVEPKFGQHPEHHYYLGIALFNLNNIDLAEKEFQRTIQLSPELDRARFMLAKCRASQGDETAALEIYRNLVKDRPSNPIYWTVLAESLNKLAINQTEALAAGRRAVALAPNNPFALFTTANILMRQGDYVSARPLLENAVAVNPDSSAFHAALARTYTRLKEPSLARKEMQTIETLREKGVEIAPLPDPGGNR